MTSTTARRRALGALAAAVALLALSACGGAAGDTEDTEPFDGDAQALVFAECMRDNGVDMPDPGPGQEGLGGAFRAVAGDHDRETIAQALSACEDLMPQYASEEQHQDVDMLDLAECLREQGLDVSDDPFGDAHGGDVDVNEFSAAMEVCRDVLIRGSR